MPDGPAASSVFNAADRTSGPVICSYMTGWGSQGRESEETIVDRSTEGGSVMGGSTVVSIAYWFVLENC